MSAIRSPWNIWPVHGFCRSGHHEMCTRYEEWNLLANFACGCEECDHPKPTREEYEAREIATYGRVRFADNSSSELDSTTETDVASWFVADGDENQPNGHEEAQEPETEMSTTEAVAPVEEPEVVEPESVDEPDSEDTVDAAEEASDTSNQRKRGELEQEVKGITDKFLSGKIKLPEDKQLTPHYIALAIEQAYGYSEPPSTGAVSAVLKRWKQYDYAEFGEDPFHFVGLTEAGEAQGLEALRESFKEARREERRKAREAKAAAKESEADEADEAEATEE